MASTGVRRKCRLRIASLLQSVLLPLFWAESLLLPARVLH
jgi:hypothetical protein